MDEKSQAELIIDELGGLTKTAKLLAAEDKPVPVSTVQGWKERGRIPEEYWGALISAGKSLGIDIAPTRFLPPMTAEIFDSWFAVNPVPEDAA